MQKQKEGMFTDVAYVHIEDTHMVRFYKNVITSETETNLLHIFKRGKHSKCSKGANMFKYSHLIF